MRATAMPKLFRAGSSCASCGAVLYASQRPLSAGGGTWQHAVCSSAPVPGVDEVVLEVLRRLVLHPGVEAREVGAVERLSLTAPRTPMTPALAAAWAARVERVSRRAAIELDVLAAPARTSGAPIG